MLQPLPNQAELFNEISQGNEGAFRALVMHYKDVVYSAAIRMTGSPQLAEDVLQDAFLKVWLKREALPTIGNFGGWLYRIVQNQILNALKKLTAEAELTSQIQEKSETDLRLPSHTLEQKELEKMVDTAVRNLPEKQMHAYILVKVVGLSRDEAAGKLQVSPETIKSNLDHAMRFIRAFCLKNLGDTYVVGLSAISFIIF